MKIYNTLTRKKEEFKPINDGKVNMYVCGPTVYNYIHIGNARPMIVFDTVRRYMMYKGFDVNYVSNFTDVDDKIIKKANEENTTSDVISKRFIEECKKDMEALNVLSASHHPLATGEISGMIDMISTLIDKGYAYATDDGTVYYRTRKFADYGKLSHKNIDELEAGHRNINVTGEQKEDSLDFVLWKPKKEGEPYWESPWSEGRPGWHIECSVMAKRYLADNIDIHAGGEDLIFPHHENEIAQSEAANGVTFANYWMHNGFLNIDNKKMSKSLGNFFTVRDIEKKYDLQVLRFFMLSAHYRSPLNFSDELMEAAKAGLFRIRNSYDNLVFLLDSSSDETDCENDEFDKAYEVVERLVKRFEDAMEDDFNTADAISIVFELVRFINQNVNDKTDVRLLKLYLKKLSMLCDILGITLKTEDKLLPKDIEKMIEDRQIARKNKDFKTADKIRDELLKQGIVLEDTREGVKYKWL